MSVILIHNFLGFKYLQHFKLHQQLCSAMGYCVYISGFTGERCDMLKRRNFLHFKCIQYMYRRSFFRLNWSVEVKSIYIQSLLVNFDNSSTLSPAGNWYLLLNYYSSGLLSILHLSSYQVFATVQTVLMGHVMLWDIAIAWMASLARNAICVRI